MKTNNQSKSEPPERSVSGAASCSALSWESPSSLNRRGFSGDMKTIWKFPIAMTDLQKIKMPVNFEVVHVDLDPAGDPCVWAVVSPSNETKEICVWVVGTGAQIPAESRLHIGTFKQGPFVWHVFISA